MLVSKTWGVRTVQSDLNLQKKYDSKVISSMMRIEMMELVYEILAI